MSEQRSRSGLSRPAGIARHGRLTSPNPWLAALKFVGISIVVIAVSAVSILSINVYSNYASVNTVALPSEEGGQPPPSIDALPGGFNILVVGNDTGVGQGDYLGDARGSAQLNDVNILLHVAADHSNAVAVSFPRDLVVPIPSCTDPESGKTRSAMSAQPINVALSHGGLGCVAKTVENFTGVRIDYAGMITFTGVIEMSNAVGGVPVCFSEDIKDPFTLFERTAGVHSLSGWDALMFLRSRHGVGDGSDLTRISSQQVYMSSLVRTLKSSDTLSDPVKVYNLARAALANMTMSEGLKSADTMYQMALALKDIPLESVVFTQYPGSTGNPQGTPYFNKVKPNTTLGNKLFEKIRADEPFLLPKAGDGIGAVLDPNATPLPTEPSASPESPEDPSAAPEPAPGPEPETIPGLRGQTAFDQTCAAKL